MGENIVEVVTCNDNYKLMINGVEIRDVASFSLYKQGGEKTEITITFNCALETKEQY